MHVAGPRRSESSAIASFVRDFLPEPSSEVVAETLSVILPVANRQQQVAANVEHLLETLSDLTDEVQLIVVDDASTDATPEILEEMRRRYPQLATVRNRTPQGPIKAVESALPHALGDFIFLHESYEPIELESLKHLWALRHDHELVVARAATRRKRIDESLLQRLMAWGKSLEEHWKQETRTLDEKPLEHGLQMMRREAVELLSRVDPKRADLEVSHLSQRRLVRSQSRS